MYQKCVNWLLCCILFYSIYVHCKCDVLERAECIDPTVDSQMHMYAEQTLGIFRAGYTGIFYHNGSITLVIYR